MITNINSIIDNNNDSDNEYNHSNDSTKYRRRTTAPGTYI